MIKESLRIVLTTCKKCDTENWSYWTSSSSGKIYKYCKTCRVERAATYSKRKKESAGSHSRAEWLKKLALFKKCPGCKRKWSEIPPRPDKRYKFVWTKDHITPLNQGGTDLIENIQPLCYRCNFGKR